MAPATTHGTGCHVGTSRATHARSALYACTRQSACTCCEASLRPHCIRSVTATVGRAHVRSQALAPRTAEEPILLPVAEPTTGDATTPFDRRRDGVTFWPSSAPSGSLSVSIKPCPRSNACHGTVLLIHPSIEPCFPPSYGPLAREQPTLSSLTGVDPRSSALHTLVPCTP